MPEARLQRTREAYCGHGSLEDCWDYFRCNSCGARLPKSFVQDWLGAVLRAKVLHRGQTSGILPR